MEPQNEKKQLIGFKHGFPVIIKDDRSGFQFPASMCINDTGGMYIEANYAPQPGFTFHIFSDYQKLDTGPGGCAAVIQWRRLLRKSESSWPYRLGIKYV